MSYHVRLLAPGDQPVTCYAHPGPLDAASAYARQLLANSSRPAVEVCEVLFRSDGSHTGPRVARIERP